MIQMKQLEVEMKAIEREVPVARRDELSSSSSSSSSSTSFDNDEDYDEHFNSTLLIRTVNLILVL